MSPAGTLAKVGGPDALAKLIGLAKKTHPALLVSTSGLGNGTIPGEVARAADFLLVHFNGTKIKDVDVTGKVISSKVLLDGAPLAAAAVGTAILVDPTAPASLVNLAADPTTWGDLYLASLEDAGLLRPDGALPPIRTQQDVVWLVLAQDVIDEVG